MKISKSHSFDIDLAEKYGIRESLLINHFAFYISMNMRNGKNFEEGRTWVYHTLDELASYFPYMTKEEVRTTIDRLCNGKSRKSKGELEFEPLLMTGNFNQTSFDRTTWYAFIDESVLNSNKSYERAQAQIEKCSSPNQSGLEPITIPSTLPSSKETCSVCVDQPPVAASPHEITLIYTIEKTKAGGEKYTIERNEIFLAAVSKRKDWTTQEIDDVWKTLVDYQHPINDPIAFCEGIIKNKRKMKGLKECKSLKKTIFLKETPQNTKKCSTEKGSLVRPFQNWKLTPGKLTSSTAT